MEAARTPVRCIKYSVSALEKSFVYINCPKCNKRLIQARASAMKPKTYTVDKAHPADEAELTIKCERCKSIVAIAK